MQRVAVTPQRLVADFGPRAAVAAAAVRALADAATHARAHEAFTAWTRRLDLLHGQQPLARVAPAELAALCSAHDVASAGHLLFALHTWYALVIKLTAVAAVLPDHTWSPDTRAALAVLESGELLRRAGLGNMAERGDFDWYLEAWTDALESPLRGLLARWSCLVVDPTAGDLFKNFYHATIPAAVRHALGEYYTPDWLAEHTLDLSGYTGEPRTRCLDASCGSGTFLVLALRRARVPLEQTDPDDALDALLAAVVGFDLNPLAVLAARVNYLLALGPLLHRRDRTRVRDIPVHLVDAVLDPDDPRFHHAFDIVVGNPPHVSWRHLPGAWRRQAAQLFERYGLFTLTGIAAQHGGSQKDLAALFIYAVLDRFVKSGGTLALVVHTSLFKTDGAGEGFRRFRLGDDAAFCVDEAHDFSAFQPFQTDADPHIKTRTLSFRATKGEPTVYPVPYHVWTKARRGAIASDATWAAARTMLRSEPLAAQPLRGPLSPWMCTRRGALEQIQRILAPRDHSPAYHAHVGAYTGGLNGCYWLEVLEHNDDGTLLVENCADIGKKPVRRVRATIEADLVHPLLRGRQVARWTSAPSGHILMVQDPARKAGYPEPWLQRHYPRTHAFLVQFAAELRARPVYQKFFAASSAPFYSMYSVRSETFATHKVVWMEISATVKASLISTATKVVIPDHKVILVAVGSAQEGDYLAGVLNSDIVGAALRSYAVDNNVATNLLKNVAVPAFDAANAIHAAIAAAARDIRHAVADHDPTARTRGENLLNAAVEPLWT